MHYPSVYDSEKSHAIHSSVTALGLLEKKKKKKKKKKEDERNEWVAIFRTPTYTVIPMKLKAAVRVDTPVQHF